MQQDDYLGRVTEESRLNGSDEAEVDRESTPCLDCHRLAIDHSSPSHVYNPQSMTDATLAKCSGKARKCKRKLILLLLGTGLITLGLAFWIFDPLAIAIKWGTRFSEESLVFEMWRKPTFIVNIDIYVFNVTNPEGFLRGEKLKLEELGPYLYEERLENTDAKFNDNGTLTFTPIRNVTLSKKFIRDPREDFVILPNIALIGLISAISNLPLITTWTIQGLASAVGAEPFINITVHDLLWGYEDPFIRIANTMVPNYIPFQKLGVFDVLRRQVSSLTMNVNEEDPDVFSLQNMNGKPGIDYWGYGKTFIETENGTLVPELLKCNAVLGSYEGVLFRKNLPRNSTPWVYRKSSCRPIPLVFDREDSVSGLKVDRYVIKNDTMMPTSMNPENVCYCDDDQKPCLPVGVAEVTPCYYSIPIAISYPHFLDADERLSENIEGLSPDAEKHDTFLLIQPEIGVSIGGSSRIQTNLIARTSKMRRIARFHNMIVPLLWMDTSLREFPGYLIFILHLAVHERPIIQAAAIVLFLAGGMFLVLKVIAQHYFSLKGLKHKMLTVCGARKKTYFQG